MTEAVVAVNEEEIEAQLPIPVGYRVLIALPQVEDTYGDTGLVKSTTTKQQEHIMSIIGLVLDMGDLA